MKKERQTSQELGGDEGAASQAARPRDPALAVGEPVQAGRPSLGGKSTTGPKQRTGRNSVSPSPRPPRSPSPLSASCPLLSQTAGGVTPYSRDSRDGCDMPSKNARSRRQSTQPVRSRDPAIRSERDSSRRHSAEAAASENSGLAGRRAGSRRWSTSLLPVAATGPPGTLQRGAATSRTWRRFIGNRPRPAGTGGSKATDASSGCCPGPLHIDPPRRRSLRRMRPRV